MPMRRLVDRMDPRPRRDDALPVDRILRLIGLGIRGRGAVVGVERVRESARTGKLAFAIVAADASKNSLKPDRNGCDAPN